ncbi:alpha-2,8-sialyltransferase 8E-like [Sinocyclocheilus anshuiensis]|uniref:alpha-2,8-sialyltransferase 8E-like n=1 Tax=Sinocyclocheilus anshuiensis TaxID=1608454 RepID=UPI0007B7F9DB|nr:PREDICTED: alpha-2,8-sialyltransferase 8E-like [Sinocyclocheilus anshuiensis]
MTDRFKLLNCMKLRQKFSNITPAKSIDMTNVTGYLSAFMSCPHVSNRTQKEQHRLRLCFCCNATNLLYLTKKNTAVNQSITYETSNRVYKVGAALHKMLPEDFPWSSRGHLVRCAVVGNGGILKNSSCGREIDSADFVIRLNLAPVNGSDVGVKTDLVTINPSQLSADFRNMAVNPGPLVRHVSVYGNVSLMIPAFAYTVCTAVSIKTLQVFQPIRPQQPVVFFSPYYLKTLDRFWKGLGLKEKRFSTGFMLVNMALELCDDVHLYGFWPFDINLKQQTLQHHYYDNKPPKPFVHAMPEEFIHLLQLHSQGALTLHLQPCL